MSTVSISKVIRITPGALAAGGTGVVLSGLLLSQNNRVPIGVVQAFGSETAVGNFFGETTVEARAAAKYFAGNDTATKTPATLRFSQYNTVDVGAYLRGGNISDMTLAQLQAISGTLSIVLDGVTKSGTPNLSGATSKTNAAQIIAKALAIKGPQSATFTGAIAGTVLTASSVTGTIQAGGVIGGAGISPATTYVVAQLTGPPGGAGTYTVSDSQTVASEAMTAAVPAVTYDSVSGGLIFISPTVGAASTVAYATGAIAADLELTLTTGAVLSQGADAQTDPAAYMNSLIQTSTAFAFWGLTFNPDDVDENDVRFAFAEWNGDQNSRYAYVSIDSDASPTVTVPATTSLAQRVIAANIDGVILNWQPTPDDPLDYANLTAFTLGIAASIDWTATKGRTNFDYRSQSGMTVGVSDDTIYDNLKANGYNFYDVTANGEEQFRWYTNGSITGDFLWSDSYANQIALNGSFVSDLANLLKGVGFIPYNSAGRTLIEGALTDTIEQFLTFGAYNAGVALSSSQIAAVNGRAGKDIASTLTNQGWYLDIGVAAPEVRQARGSPPMTFYYVDGQSVQEFDMASIVLV